MHFIVAHLWNEQGWLCWGLVSCTQVEKVARAQWLCLIVHVSWIASTFQWGPVGCLCYMPDSKYPSLPCTEDKCTLPHLYLDWEAVISSLPQSLIELYHAGYVGEVEIKLDVIVHRGQSNSDFIISCSNPAYALNRKWWQNRKLLMWCYIVSVSKQYVWHL